MIPPRAVHLFIRHYDAIDVAVSKHLTRKRPWSEPALTSFLCDLMDETTQGEEPLNYSLAELNKDLAALDGLLDLTFSIDTHEYDSNMERWVTQADLGLIISYEDYLLPSESWSAAWLLQAKRLQPISRNPLVYTDRSRFAAYDPEQHQRIEHLQNTIGCDFFRYIFYCPRPDVLDKTTRAKLARLRMRGLSEDIFDFTLGLELRDCLSGSDSSLAAGVFVCEPRDIPTTLGAVHDNILRDCWPLSWFIVGHFFKSKYGVPRQRSVGDRRMKEDRPEVSPTALEWAKGIVKGDRKAVKRLIDRLGERNDCPFPVLPAHTITVSIRVGSDLDPDSRGIRRE